MFLGMQGFDFCQNRIKYHPNFTQILFKFAQIGLNLAQICLKNVLGDKSKSTASPAPTPLFIFKPKSSN